MKLEYLAKGGSDCPLVRLYQFEQAEVVELRNLLKLLVSGSQEEIPLHERPWVESVAGCQLFLRLGKWDQGIRQIGSSRFECLLTSLGWDNVEGVLEPFCESRPGGCQWLTKTGKIPFLLSQTGRW